MRSRPYHSLAVFEQHKQLQDQLRDVLRVRGVGRVKSGGQLLCVVATPAHLDSEHADEEDFTARVGSKFVQLVC